MKKEITGYTLPYATITLALRIALVEYFESYEKIHEKNGNNDELEARRVMIVILSAALCEACINTWLAVNLDEDVFALIEKSSTVEKWTSAPKLIINSYSFSRGTIVHEDLKFVFHCRNAIMHSKTEVFSGEEKLHKGNYHFLEDLKHDRIIRIAGASVELLNHLNQFDQMNLMTSSMTIHSSVSYCLGLSEFEKLV